MGSILYLRKGIVIPAVAIAAVLIAALAAGTAFAQEQTNSNNTMSSIKGSVDVRGTMQNYIKDNLKVSFTTAANTAAAQVQNGTIVSGNLGIVQGFLAYKFFIVNEDTHVGRIVVVDAGNGQVLYTSGDMHAMNGFGTGMMGGQGLKGHGLHVNGGSSHAALKPMPQGIQS